MPTEHSVQRMWSPSGVNLRQKVFNMSDQKLIEHIKQLSISTYGQEVKPKQLEGILNLINGRNTFYLAGTGHGKLRVAEMYLMLFPSKSHPVVLTLNPLDTLGDNQVLEKQNAGFTAINLTAANFTPEIAEEVKAGLYQFVYLSPEIFLNNNVFSKTYFSSEFQQRLALIVVDEAHMIYIWGLVDSSTSKKSTSAHYRFEDYGIFRPSYGKLGAQLLFRNDKPILLLSATCRPVAIQEILKSLKLSDDSIDLIKGELTRPEIRIIRVPMAKSLASSLDAIKLIPSSRNVADDEMVPTLVYSGSRNRTMTLMEVISLGRETPGSADTPDSKCVRRFHSCTGDEDKVTCAADFAAGKFPVISCTMALGLGQNWKRVRMVSHVGRGDPANICQMIGRCGRDGNNGLAVMFMEKTRRGGKNHIHQFTRGATQTDLDRMDALAITPLCLRVAFSMDNLCGYVPLWADDPLYLSEQAREVKMGMPICKCSNCAPEAAEKVIQALAVANKSNFDNILNDTFTTPEIYNLSSKYPAKSSSHKKRKFTKDDKDELSDFAMMLITDLYHHYNTEDECDAILASLDNINEIKDVRGVIGGESFTGQTEWVFKWICDYKANLLAGRPAKTPSTPVTKKPRHRAPREFSSASSSQKSIGLGPSPWTKSTKAPDAETKQRVSLEKQAIKKAAKEIEEKRKIQVAQIMAESRREEEERIAGKQANMVGAVGKE
ncbi:hypothetical protein PSTG_03318 [Puccinia striiformis f. sp. tritici PST-78]|uniref:DNA 3'-5' helicase n=2 Tax=Puccinia striiformis f. sp. tritici TaxID=168172 RepID=A0A0L0VVZ9_9BASI|nr:hypothetical protein PSTG_03318 [Puccinia striiformis f. sp. tritici PST-78]